MRGDALDDVFRYATLGAGLFVLANGAGELVSPGFSALGEWLSVAQTGILGSTVGIVLGSVLSVHGLGVQFGRMRWPAVFVVTAAALVALFDTAGFYRSFFAGRIHTPIFVPASLLVALGLAGVATALVRGREPARPPEIGAVALTAAAVILALPLIRVFTFGLTRYERRADVAVVLGARAYADGTPSLALADRVDEAVRAYHAGLVQHLVMSGGIDPHTYVSEAQVMRDRAVRAGVPPSAIAIDEAGASTALTARNVARLLPAGTSVLLVSHYFHLPRTALLFRRQGFQPFTLPARMTRHLLHEPWYVLREVPAFYAAWLTG